ncbi:hypothetical protein [Niabella drilacis]|uniref:Uncharacterized protein n=1 Tax=Niabella drilacis (strain DSM 25811 / CCM 8410 / CCUG 62505 / LMG 26954 / E90) TaxID=1285928 RepID=A0A1G6LGK0_NIADE|nr:hypothetical protein [Niabella drilacis]SDC42361.1 hypothetical protein SAMN04487894_102342 [Niabella drilacis]
MIVYFELIEDLCSKRVDVYTVRIDDEAAFEYEKYYEKEFVQHDEERDFIDSALEEIRKRGALRRYFRNEGPADALPNGVPDEIVKLNENDQGIRLYCIRLSDNVLILLNGDIKTIQDPKDCPNVRKHFLFAQRLACFLTTYIFEEGIDLVNDRYCFHKKEVEL